MIYIYSFTLLYYPHPLGSPDDKRAVTTQGIRGRAIYFTSGKHCQRFFHFWSHSNAFRIHFGFDTITNFSTMLLTLHILYLS